MNGEPIEYTRALILLCARIALIVKADPAQIHTQQQKNYILRPLYMLLSYV